MSMTIAALKSELLADPNAIGYAPLLAAADDQALADALNLVRAGAAYVVARDDVTSKEIIESIAVADFVVSPASPTAVQLSTERRYIMYLQMLTTVPTVRLQLDNGSDAPVIANLAAVFTPGSATLTRLNALRTRQGSRAEVLWGKGTVVNANQVGAARNLP